jgi:hypothetical protein
VITSSSTQVKGAKGLLEKMTTPSRINVADLRENIAGFIGSVNELLSGIPKKTGIFNLDEIELTVQVSAEGTIQLIGGIKAGATGGITLRMKR